MIKKNDIVQLEITDITNEGMGVGHADGLAVFVPFTCIGDVIDAHILKVKSSYAYGKCTAIKSLSASRVQPQCPAYKKCGGCQLMHIEYAAQKEIKRKFVYDALVRIGGQSKDITVDFIGAPDETGYRNKMVYPIGKDKDNKTVCGFYAQRSHNIISLDSCVLGMGDDQAIITAVLEYMNKYKVQPYDEFGHKGAVRRIFIRRGRFSKETMVVISSNSRSLPCEEELCKLICRADDTVNSIILNINTKKTNLVLGNENRTIYGSNVITDTLCGNEYEISPHSFFQINPVQTENLYNKAIEYADITCDDTVMDIYCGIGTISLTAAKKAKKVIGVEIVDQAIEDAKKNASSNGIENAQFYAGSAEDIVPKLIKSGEKPDIVIIDPPRKGSDEVTLSTIIESQPKRVVYVSCNPATLARDINFLNQGGYTLKMVTAVDMFPNTVHVEAVALLQHEQLSLPDGK